MAPGKTAVQVRERPVAVPRQVPPVEPPSFSAAPTLPQRATFLSHVHSLRGLAILVIVAGHCVLCFRWERSPQLGSLLWVVFTNGTVLFVFIAGFLFQHLSGKYRFGSYLKSKLTNVILPYLILSVPAIAFCVVRRWHPGDSFGDTALQVATYYVTGSFMPAYWFIPLITTYYLASPLLIWWDRHEWAYWLLPLFLGVSLYVPRSDLPTSCVHFFSVYLLGMFCSHYREKVLAITRRLVPILVITCLAVPLMAYLGAMVGSALNLVQKLSLCILLLYWLEVYDQFLKKFFAYLATVSFGIYFIHPYVVWALAKLAGKAEGRELFDNVHYGFLNVYYGFLGEGSLAACFACFAAVVLISTLVAATARRLFGSYSRMIVGS